MSGGAPAIGEHWREQDTRGRVLTKPRILMLGWSDGTRAKERGEDFASVIARLPGDRLAHWWRVFRRGACYHERRMIEAEMECRRISTREADANGQMLMF